MRPLMKCTSRDSRSSRATTMGVSALSGLDVDELGGDFEALGLGGGRSYCLNDYEHSPSLERGLLAAPLTTMS
jgi:hypothetical protein